ncbi:CGNR zinc finger domain-containing protein [Sphaerimonospora sp. CA-214678]|uniref:CGNR zinc finger domain-containing protein n=1 Tax=Sphaerimonospora sp. CA-214678 TaxID=3240029 RepID=UPI003D92CA55
MESAAARGLILHSPTGVAYRFDAGALCLELLTTGGPGLHHRYEALHRPADLTAWTERSRLTPTPRLRISDAEVADARRLRDALFRVAIAHTRAEPPAARDFETINQAASHPSLTPVIGSGGNRRWSGTASGSHLLATVARDAIDLFTGALARRIRTCADEECGLIYVDTSRPGRRRWCSMEHCGNRHKVRALRARQDA